MTSLGFGLLMLLTMQEPPPLPLCPITITVGREIASWVSDPWSGGNCTTPGHSDVIWTMCEMVNGSCGPTLFEYRRPAFDLQFPRKDRVYLLTLVVRDYGQQRISSVYVQDVEQERAYCSDDVQPPTDPRCAEGTASDGHSTVVPIVRDEP